jgi:ATP-dependent DNA helicase DinG
METETLTRAAEAIRKHGPAVGLHQNPVQQAYADFVAEGIDAARNGGDARPGGQLFAEAETGVGKTIGYLVAAGLDCVEHGSRAIIATHTLALQHQIIDRLPNGELDPGCDMAKALRIIELETGVRLKAALRIGRRNFVDSDRVRTVVQRLRKTRELSAEDDADLSALEGWADEHPGGEFRQFLEEYGLDALPCGLAQEDICINAETNNKVARAALERHVKDTHDADLVVTNHALLIRQAIAIGQPILEGDDPNDTRPLGVIVVDECDRFPDAAASASSELLPLNSFLASARAWSTGNDAERDAVIKAIEDLREHMMDLRDQFASTNKHEVVALLDDMSASERKAIVEHIEAIGSALSPLMLRPVNADENETELREHAQELASIYRAIKGMQQPDAGTTAQKASVVALRWSPTKHYPSLRTFRLQPARLLKRIWSVWTGSDADAEAPSEQLDLFNGRAKKPRSRAKALILTSATVSAPSRNDQPDLTEISDAYGIYPPSNACNDLNRRGMVFTPKRFGTAKIVFSDPAAPMPFLPGKEAPAADMDEEDEILVQINPAWVSYITKMAAAAHAEGGRVLVLGTSYRATAALAESMRAAGLPVIEKTRDVTVGSCASKLVADPGGVFVTPGSWEGFDISRFTGPDGKPAKIKHVIMSQIPFGRVDNGFNRAMAAELQRRGMSAERSNRMIHAIMRAHAARKAKQGFGRGIRGPSDSFTFWIGDVRFPRHASYNAKLPANPAAKTYGTMAYIIPRRFRQSVGIAKSAWDQATLFTVDGCRISRTGA